MVLEMEEIYKIFAGKYRKNVVFRSAYSFIFFTKPVREEDFTVVPPMEPAGMKEIVKVIKKMKKGFKKVVHKIDHLEKKVVGYENDLK
jgi:hypothetical protein